MMMTQALDDADIDYLGKVATSMYLERWLENDRKSKKTINAFSKYGFGDWESAKLDKVVDEAEKAKMLRHRKEKEMRRTSPVRITLEASRSCVTEPSILRTSTTISPNKKKKSFALPNIVKSYTISSTNNNVFKTIQQSSRNEKKINLFLTNLKY